MKSLFLLFNNLFFCFFQCTTMHNDRLLNDFPHVILSNDILETSVFLPDPDKGFYRSTRFDWSGMNYHLSYNGHSYFLQQNEKNPLPLRQDHSPYKSDNACGLADQFQNGPERKATDTTYVIIGIGTFKIRTNQLIDPGTWESQWGENWLECVHTLTNKNGYHYRYRKRMELINGEPELIIYYQLENNGTRLLSCQQYNHNFFSIDNTLINEQYEVQLNFSPVFKTYHPKQFEIQKSFHPYAKIDQNTIHILKSIDVTGGIFSIIEGFSNSVSHHYGIIRNKKNGAAVIISGDIPLSEFHFWADDMTICPEFFIPIHVKPGETQEWKRVYRFYEE